MDAQWVVDALGRWLHAAYHVITDDEVDDFAEGAQESPENQAFARTVLELWPVVRAVAEEVSPPRSLPLWSDGVQLTFKDHMAVVDEIRAEVSAQVDIERYVRTSAPRFDISKLHPWVWDSARPLWEVNRQDALNAAARAVNSRLQRKVNRPNTNDVDLTNQSFSERDVTADGYRLRFPGERNDTWRSRMGGARGLGEACFRGVRNLTSHEHQLELSEVVALEYLTMFSTLCRWIEECAVWGEHGEIIQATAIGTLTASGSAAATVQPAEG